MFKCGQWIFNFNNYMTFKLVIYQIFYSSCFFRYFHLSFLSLNRRSIFVLILIYFIILIFDVLADLFIFSLVPFILSFFFLNFVIFGWLLVIDHRKVPSFIKVRDKFFHKQYYFTYSSFLGMPRVETSSNHLYNSRLYSPSRMNILIYLVDRFI